MHREVLGQTGELSKRVAGERRERCERGGSAGSETESVGLLVSLVVLELLQRVHELGPLVVSGHRHVLKL